MAHPLVQDLVTAATKLATLLKDRRYFEHSTSGVGLVAELELFDYIDF